MDKLKVAVAAALINGLIVASGVSGELTKYACAAGSVSSLGVIGKIIQSSGDVLYSGSKGYTEAKVGANLVSGSQISVGDGGSAKISVGSNCNLPIGSNSIATVIQKNGSGDVYVSIANQLNTSSELVQEGTSTQALFGGLAGLGGLGAGAVVGGIVGGIAIGTVVQAVSTPASP